MTIVDEAKVAGWAAKNLLYIGLAIAVLIGLALGYYFVVVAPANAKHDAAAATAGAAVATAGQASAHAAIEIVSGNAQHAASTNDTVRIIHDTIVQAPGASAAITPELHDAGSRGLCMFDAYAGDPDCQRLRQPSP